LVNQKKLTLAPLTEQVKVRMRKFWESRMQRILSFLGMPMKARGHEGPEKEGRVRTYKEYLSQGGVAKEVSLFTDCDFINFCF
jgi:hypothetical protein